jgi:opacity protein-like surface antigen
MRRKFLLGIGLLAFAAAGAGSAGAADIAARPAGGPPPVAAPAYVPEWVGFYVGINGGGGGGRTSFNQAFFESPPGSILTPGFAGPPIFQTNSSPSGGVFGFQWGYNWQWGPVVGGLEIDFDGASLNDTTTFATTTPLTFPTSVLFSREFKIDELASTRGRLGYLITPTWLIYGTAGIGWAHTREVSTASVSATGFDSLTSYSDRFGWVVGAGLEWQFFPHWLLRKDRPDRLSKRLQFRRHSPRKRQDHGRYRPGRSELQVLTRTKLNRRARPWYRAPIFLHPTGFRRRADKAPVGFERRSGLEIRAH